MVFQRPNPFPAMSIYDNVCRGSIHAHQSAATRTLVEESLTKAGLWNEVGNRLRALGVTFRRPAAAAVHRPGAGRPPAVLLMDEPCSALDPASTRRIERPSTRSPRT